MHELLIVFPAGYSGYYYKLLKKKKKTTCDRSANNQQIATSFLWVCRDTLLDNFEKMLCLNTLQVKWILHQLFDNVTRLVTWFIPSRKTIKKSSRKSNAVKMGRKHWTNPKIYDPFCLYFCLINILVSFSYQAFKITSLNIERHSNISRR